MIMKGKFLLVNLCNLVEDSISLFFKYFSYLFSSPLIWGIAGAVSLAVTAYAEHQDLEAVGAASCLFMPQLVLMET